MSPKKNGNENLVKFPPRQGKKASAQQEPLGTGSVATPATPQKPTGYQWDMLEKAKGAAEVRKVQEWAEQNGFSATGQFMTAIRSRLGEG